MSKLSEAAATGALHRCQSYLGSDAGKQLRELARILLVGGHPLQLKEVAQVLTLSRWILTASAVLGTAGNGWTASGRSSAPGEHLDKPGLFAPANAVHAEGAFELGQHPTPHPGCRWRLLRHSRNGTERS